MFLQAEHQVANTSTMTGFPCSSCARGAPIEAALDAQGFALDAQGFALDAQGFALDAQGFALDAQGFALASVLVLADVFVFAAQGFEQPAITPKLSNEVTASTEKKRIFMTFFFQIELG
ncbi:hypothetical protein [Leptolyngbya sp. FACHB-1624]|uniref:hypothetical protein n=1 Tax=Leptolyngbya TaxID=47251 RepID=UPI0018F025C4